MLAQIVFHNAYLNFSFELGGVQQGHFEGGGFKSLGVFLGRFEVFVWGHLLRHVICFSVFVKVLGVLFLNTYIKKGSQMIQFIGHPRYLSKYFKKSCLEVPYQYQDSAISLSSLVTVAKGKVSGLESGGFNRYWILDTVCNQRMLI